jgi:chromosome partitioning protein
MRNRRGQLESRNKQAMDKAIDVLAKRIGFVATSGFSERVIFRELFLEGLTLLDLRQSNVKMNMSHLAARQEIRSLMQQLGLPVWQDTKLKTSQPS